MPTILELVQKCLADTERTEGAIKLAVGLVGDLADAFPNGQIKEFLLADWVTGALRTKGRGRELKTTVRWAKEVRVDVLRVELRTDDPQMVKRATQ